jgi:polyhydroxybutyrate depolymerase
MGCSDTPSPPQRTPEEPAEPQEPEEKDTGVKGESKLDASDRRDANSELPIVDAATTDASSFKDAAKDVDAASPLDASAPDPSACDLALLAPGDHDYTITSKNGLTYKYTLVVPATVQAKQRAPLAVVWHALRSSPEETRGLTDIDAIAADARFYTVHPRSPDASWDTGSCCTTAVLGWPRDELVFTKELLADVKTKVCVDDKRIYTTGFSNGGMMSQKLACQMSEVFAAAGPMGSTLTIDPNQCKPARAVPMFMVNGTADPLVGYAVPSLSGGLTVPADFAHWAERNGCTGQPEVTLEKGKVSCETYKQCKSSSEVTLCTVDGMGHCMPGMKEESPTNCFTKGIPLGQPNADIDGQREVFNFLQRFSLP